MSDAGLIDPALQEGSGPSTSSLSTGPGLESNIQPDLASVSTEIEASLPLPLPQGPSQLANPSQAGEPEGEVDPSVVQEALDGLVSMVKQDNEDVDELSAQPGDDEAQKLRRELAQARQHIALLQQELTKYRPIKQIIKRKPSLERLWPVLGRSGAGGSECLWFPSSGLIRSTWSVGRAVAAVKPVPPPKVVPQRRGSLPPNEATLQKYRDEVGTWRRTTYDPATIPHINNFGQNERQETNLRIAFANLDGQVPDEQEWKAWIAERLRLVDDVLDGAKTWAQQPNELKELAMDVAEKRWAALMLCDDSRWKAVEFLSRRQEQRLKKPRVPKSGKKREASEALGHSVNGHDDSVSASPAQSHHHNENGDIDISDSPAGKRPRLDDLLVDPQLQQLLQQHQAEEEAAGRHNFVLGDAAALVAQRENGDIQIDGDDAQPKDSAKEGGEFDNLDPALHAAVSSSFADATALVEGLEGLQGIDGIEGMEGIEGLEGIEGIDGEYQLGDELALDYDSVTDQLQAQIQNSLNDSIHSHLGSLPGESGGSARKKKAGGAHKGPEPATPEAEALLKQHSHSKLGLDMLTHQLLLF